MSYSAGETKSYENWKLSKKRKRRSTSRAASQAVCNKLAERNTQKVHKMPLGKWKLLGGEKAETFETVVPEGAEGDRHAVWAT